MTTEIGKEAPSFAEIEDMHANQPDVFLKTVQRFVSMQDGVTKGRKEVTKTVNFLGQGKLVCMAMKDYDAMPRLNAPSWYNFDDYFFNRFGGKVPGAGATLAGVFSAFCLAPKTAARYLPESVYDQHFCRVLQAAGKIVDMASGIQGETLETSYLNHQVFIDVAIILKTGGKHALAELRESQARLVKVTKTDGEDKRQVLVYLTKAQLAARRARIASLENELIDEEKNEDE
jgi:ribosomal protein L7Ae-like RNA K-turn-binding protein